MLVNRDPFARQELHRSTVRADGRTCSWCGSVRDSGGNLGKHLYVYRTESDGGRSGEHQGAFCCKSCHDSYHS